VESSNGGYEIDLQLDRQSHSPALKEASVIVERAGFQVVEALVTESTTSWIEGSALGGFGGATLGAEIRQEMGFLIGLVVGAGVGALAGVFKSKWPRSMTLGGTISPRGCGS
jgi:phage tail tape-measure protein